MWTRVAFLHQLVHSLMYGVLKQNLFNLIKISRSFLINVVSMLNVSRVSRDSNLTVQIPTVRGNEPIFFLFLVTNHTEKSILLLTLNEKGKTEKTQNKIKTHPTNPGKLRFYPQ